MTSSLKFKRNFFEAKMDECFLCMKKNKSSLLCVTQHRVRSNKEQKPESSFIWIGYYEYRYSKVTYIDIECFATKRV